MDHASNDAQGMTDSDLLRLCELPADAPEDVVELVRLAAVLVERDGDGAAGAAVALASAMGRGGWSVQSLPFGYDGPRVEHEGWIKRDNLAVKLAQVGGMIVGGRFNADCANVAVAEALRNYWLREQRYDAWRPGMKSGSGWTIVVQAQPAGIARARELAAAPADAPRPWQAPPPPVPAPDAMPPATVNKADNRTEWLAKAMLMVRDHPDWSDAEIARRVSKHPGTLARSTEYKMAADLARSSKTDLLKGHVKTESDAGLRDVDAVAPPAAPADDRSDRGTPIPGSRYFREYCAECKEPMGVTKDKVGTKPLCEHCAQ